MQKEYEQIIRTPFVFRQVKPALWKAPLLGAFLFGGPEENRTPVRKTIRGAFSERILSFEIPSPQRRQTGFAHR